MNIKNSKYYAFSISNFILFHVPILTIYFNSILKSVTLVSILFLVKSVTVFIFELPTGYISDRYSRKLSLILSVLLNIFSLILFICSPNFYGLLLGEFLFGLSECLASGSNLAFYYDNFTAEDRFNDYNIFIKNIGLIQSIFLSIAFFIGSILYDIDSSIVFIGSIIFQFIALIILLSIKEHPYKKNMTKRLTIKDELNIFINNFDKTIFYILIIYSIILAIFLSIYLQLFPIIASEVMHTYWLYGFIYVIAMLTYGFGAKNGTKDITNLPKILILLFLISILGIICTSNIYLLLIVIITRFIWGYINTGLNIYINEAISDSSFRATIFSILSILTSLFSSIFLFIMGWIIDNSLGLGYLFATWSIIILVTLLLSKNLIYLKGGECNDL